MTLRVAIVGFGKIAHDQHVPAIAATDGVTLAAVADPKASQPDLPHFKTLEELLRDGPPIDAIAICTPPQMRRAIVGGIGMIVRRTPAVANSER